MKKIVVHQCYPQWFSAPLQISQMQMEERILFNSAHWNSRNLLKNLLLSRLIIAWSDLSNSFCSDGHQKCWIRKCWPLTVQSWTVLLSCRSVRMFCLVPYGVKGAGLVAQRNIEAGTLLVSEPPALRVTLINGGLSSGAGTDVSRQFSR